MENRESPLLVEDAKLASLKNKPIGQTILALAAVRREKTPPLVSAEERLIPTSMARRIQVRHRATDCISFLMLHHMLLLTIS